MDLEKKASVFKKQARRAERTLWMKRMSTKFILVFILVIILVIGGLGILNSLDVFDLF